MYLLYIFSVIDFYSNIKNILLVINIQKYAFNSY